MVAHCLPMEKSRTYIFFEYISFFLLFSTAVRIEPEPYYVSAQHDLYQNEIFTPTCRLADPAVGPHAGLVEKTSFENWNATACAKIKFMRLFSLSVRRLSTWQLLPMKQN